jgi:hypothetical protein
MGLKFFKLVPVAIGQNKPWLLIYNGMINKNQALAK